jgi:peptidoglycan/LPS O-acetylase OafA/YrhL
VPGGSGILGAPAPGNAPIQLNQVFNLLIGNAPMWGIPLVFVALLLVAAGAAALWRPRARYVPGAVVAATALLVGCFAMLGVFLIDALDPDRIGGRIGYSVGPGFWLLVFAVLLTVGGTAAVLLGRPIAAIPQAEVEREEPETPPMGFPAPVVLPELDEK